jgi:hypothetical protein
VAFRLQVFRRRRTAGLKSGRFDHRRNFGVLQDKFPVQRVITGYIGVSLDIYFRKFESRLTLRKASLNILRFHQILRTT